MFSRGPGGSSKGFLRWEHNERSVVVVALILGASSTVWRDGLILVTIGV